MAHVDCGCDCNDCNKIHVSIIQSLSNSKFMTMAIFNCNCYKLCSIRVSGVMCKAIIRIRFH